MKEARRRTVLRVAGRTARKPQATEHRYWARLGTTGRVCVGIVLTATVGALVTSIFAKYGPEIVDRFASEDPVAVVAQVQTDLSQPGMFALPGTAPDAPQKIKFSKELAAAHPDAVHVDGLDMKVIFEGKRAKPVVITDIQARITRTSEPVAGTLLWYDPQGADGTENGCIHLTDPKLTMLAVESGKSGCAHTTGTRYFDGKYLRLANGEQIVVNLQVDIGGTKGPPERWAHSYEFELIATTMVNGKAKDITVRNGAQPFRLSSFAPTYKAIYRLAEGGFEATPPSNHCVPTCLHGPN